MSTPKRVFEFVPLVASALAGFAVQPANAVLRYDDVLEGNFTDAPTDVGAANNLSETIQ